ncbi:MAG: GTPase Era [Bacilli bacterium]|nr:GTPase Era [Bacilli bacterium]
MYKSGFVSIIGRPNVGKSTLLNQILGQKISIISSTAQTTRNSIKGIYTSDKSQIVFIDTPGIHKPKNTLGEFMNKESINSLRDADLVLWLTDSSEEFGSGDEYVLNILNSINVPVILVFNKMDLIDNIDQFKENSDKFTNGYKFKNVVNISALNKENIDKLIDAIEEALPEGPKYYDENQITDSIERFIVAELIREKIFYRTKDEVPHSIAVEIEEMREQEDSTEVYACIICERDSQKKILIGKNGEMIKKIKQYSKKDIKKLLGCSIYLELFVKVDKDWRNNKTTLSRLGYKN